MNNSFYHTLLATIKNDIAAAMQQDHLGPYWLSHYFDKTSKSYTHRDNPEIFNGNAGQCLFYLHLYQLSKDSANLRMSMAILDRILCTPYIQQPRYYGCYTGLTGIIYTCIQVYLVSGQKRYLDQALTIALQHKTAITSIREMDLLTGAAGIMLVMTSLYHHTQHPDVLHIVHQLILLLIADARISQQGLKWDHHKMAFDSLTGFSHGAAGIAYALLQTSNYFRYDGLLFMAEQALEYEMQYYQPNVGNWLDLRIGHRRYNLPGAENWQLATFFPELKLLNSWAHGAAGIALARMYAYDLTGKPEYQEQVDASIAYCLSDLTNPKTDYTLCSGRTGLIPLLLRTGRHDAIQQIFQDATELYHRTGGFNDYMAIADTDTGLFSGKAGVGLMLINVLTGHADDILLPTLPKNPNPANDLFSKSTVSKYIYSKYDTDPYITALWRQHKGALCYYKKITHLKRQANIPDTALLDTLYCLPDHIHPAGPGQFIEITSTDIHYLKTGALVNTILSILQTPHTGHEIYQQLQPAIPLEALFLPQLQQLLNACIITTKGCHY